MTATYTGIYKIQGLSKKKNLTPKFIFFIPVFLSRMATRSKFNKPVLMVVIRGRLLKPIEFLLCLFSQVRMFHCLFQLGHSVWDFGDLTLLLRFLYFLSFAHVKNKEDTISENRDLGNNKNMEDSRKIVLLVSGDCGKCFSLTTNVSFILYVLKNVHFFTIFFRNIKFVETNFCHNESNLLIFFYCFLSEFYFTNFDEFTYFSYGYNKKWKNSNFQWIGECFLVLVLHFGVFFATLTY